MKATWSTALLGAVLTSVEVACGQPAAPVSHGPYARMILGEKPLAYWRFSEVDRASFFASDASGNRRHAMPEPGVTAGIAGPGSPRFSGANHRNACARFEGGRLQAQIPTLGTVYTVELWFWNLHPIKARLVTGYLFSRGEAGPRGEPGDQLGIGGNHSASGRLIFYNGDKLRQLLAGKTVIPPQTWNHVVMVRSNTYLALYLNGNPEPEINGETETNYLEGAETVFIGGRNDNFANFHGKIDEVAIYDRALTPDEIAAHYAASGMAKPPLWQRPWMLIVSTLTLAGVVGGWLRFAAVRQIKRRMERLEQQRALEQERARIARDMHDELGASLARISFLSQLARQKAGPAAQARDSIEKIATTARELIRNLDQIVWAVNPANDTLDHLANYLCQYAGSFFEGTGIQCRLHVPSVLPKVVLNSAVRHNLFLACKEALHNVAKHAQASETSLRLAYAEHKLRIEIKDNGSGFDPHQANGGDGLANMRTRLESIGGQCRIESQPPGGGACVAFTLRLEETCQSLETRTEPVAVLKQ